VSVDTDKFIVANISNRHVHLNESDFIELFGEGAKLKSIRDLVQPGQFACRERVTIVGPGGKIDNVRIIGPIRKYTQVEISRTDSYILKFSQPPLVRDSGNLAGSSPVTIIGPKSKVSLKEGCIIAKRHIHFTPQDAERFCIKDKQIVSVRAGIGTDRTVIFEEVLCRVGEKMALECHLDTDEANACGLKNGDKVEIII